MSVIRRRQSPAIANTSFYLQKKSLKMSHDQLLSSLSPERKQFVWKIYNEMVDNAYSTIPDRENEKEYFLQLVDRNKQLSEIEKKNIVEKNIFIISN